MTIMDSNTSIPGETVIMAGHSSLTPTAGSAGLRTHVPGGAATVSGFAAATGGIIPHTNVNPHHTIKNKYSKTK